MGAEGRKLLILDLRQWTVVSWAVMMDSLVSGGFYSSLEE